MYAQSNKINLINCTFQNNHADECGGAVFIGDDYSNNLIESTFINNTAVNGGALYFRGSVTNTNITSLFNNNSTERAGSSVTINKYANLRF
ncbi:hypothetical protein [Methanosphaera sp. ISO3-F5]|uniref:hypothetical protein n=1 Tax=Methanosphaera sp. ISO3-F5 TaxID=1452353 RepID=UPI003964780D